MGWGHSCGVEQLASSLWLNLSHLVPVEILEPTADKHEPNQGGLSSVAL